MESPTLVIFTKRPKIGHGKQRLAADIGPQAALEIAQELFNCATEDAKSWPGPVVLAVESSHDINWAMRLGFDYHLIIPQVGENLGQRINFIDKCLREIGHQEIFFIGTDAPILSKYHYKQAIKMLGQYDTVFSPAEDGGVTIMASKLPWPKLDLLDWSGESLCNQLVALCGANYMSTGLMDTTYDVDVLEDLERLVRDLSNDGRKSRVQLHNLVEAQLDTLEFY